MDTTRTPETYLGTIADELDRLEVPASKIGLIDAKQAMALLLDLDGVYERIQGLDVDSQSRFLLETQFEGIMAMLRKETPQFLRDLGGAEVLRKARERRNPPAEREWWFLDIRLAEKRRAALKRNLTIGAVTLAALVLLIVLYNNFLAPDPILTAVYGYENNARDMMLNGELAAADAEIDKALELAPQDPTILILKGVLQEALGDTAAAEQTFARSEQIIARRDAFLVTRGQTYVYINQFEKALADGEAAIAINPDLAQGYLLMGQSNEMLGNLSAALEDYERGYAAAENSGQDELAAISRMRMAMLMQVMNSRVSPEVPLATETP